MKSVIKTIIIYHIANLFIAIGYIQKKSLTFMGKVVEKYSGQLIAYATVVVADNETKQAIDGTTTLEDGTLFAGN